MKIIEIGWEFDILISHQARHWFLVIVVSKLMRNNPKEDANEPLGSGKDFAC